MKKLGIGLLTAATAFVGAFAAVMPVATSAAAVTRPVAFTAEHAGAAVGAASVHYRYVETTFNLPSSRQLPYATGGMLSVQLRAPGEVVQLGIFAKPGDFWKAQLQNVQPSSSTDPGDIVIQKAGPATMKAGDKITLSLYYNNGYLYYNATDLTSGAIFAGRFSDPGAMFGSVRVGAEFAAVPGGVPGGAFIRPFVDYRLALLTGTKITQLNGTHVTLDGSTHLALTSTGTSAGRVRVNAPSVYNFGANTGIWVRH